MENELSVRVSLEYVKIKPFGEIPTQRIGTLSPGGYIERTYVAPRSVCTIHEPSRDPDTTTSKFTSTATQFTSSSCPYKMCFG
mmetsp:Transcript_11086/g.16590  ORF Transcript_11086/g.16590 Transcript_11086/m.16590 type:complete len:83 (-) Transcript_11086:4999-5247(-)